MPLSHFKTCGCPQFAVTIGKKRLSDLAKFTREVYGKARIQNSFSIAKLEFNDNAFECSISNYTENL